MKSPIIALALALTLKATGASEPVTGEVFSASAALEVARKSKDKRAGETGSATFFLFVPDGVETVRGVVFNPYYEKAVGQDHWRTAAAHWDFALMGANLFGIRAGEIGKVTLDGLAAVAGASGRPEVANAPLCLVGMSAGGGMSVSIAAAIPERVIAAGPVCLEVGPKNKASHAIPMVTVFGERDGKQMEKLAAKLPVAREAGAQWAISVQWGKRHEFHHANNIIMPFFDAVIAQRYPTELDPADGPPALNPHPDSAAWLGVKDEWGESPATIAAWGELPADAAARACWLPDAATAHVWRASVIEKPKLKIVSPPGLGGGQELIIHTAGEPVEVKAAVGGGLELESLKLQVGSRTAVEFQLAGEGAHTATLDGLSPGIHPLILSGIATDGGHHLSRPHTILVR